MSNSFNHLRAFSLLGCALLLTAGSSAFAGPARGDAPPKGNPYNLAVDIDAPGAVRAQIEIAIPSLKEVQRFELNATDGSLSGGIYIPAGKENRISITAFDGRGEPIYQGAGYANVEADITREISIPLSGKETKDPLLAKFGTYRLQVDFAVNAGEGYLLQTTLLDAYGKHIPFKPDDVRFDLPFDFELLKYSCFQDSLCIELPKQGIAEQAIVACLQDITCYVKKPKDTRGPFRYVSTGENHTCALTTDNKVFCWGASNFGQLGGVGTPCSPGSIFECTFSPVPVQCPANETCRFVSLAAGGNHTCAIDTVGKAWCWGDEFNPATGAPSAQPTQATLRAHRHIPAYTDLGGKVTFVSIDTDESHTCALTSAQDIYCWGFNNELQLGSNTGGAGTSNAMLVRSGSKYSSVVTGMSHSCAMQTWTGILDCWGDNSDFQLAKSLPGSGPVTNQQNFFATLTTKVPVLGGKGVSRIAAGATSTCAQNYNADLVCWGAGQHGKPANNSTPGFLAWHYAYSTSMATDKWFCAAAGTFCTKICSTDLAGDLYCGNWISTIPPQLQPIPAPVSDHYVSWTQVDVGPNHVCSVTRQQDIWCFGFNSFGQFGTGTNIGPETFGPSTAVVHLP